MHDLSYLEEMLNREAVLSILRSEQQRRPERENVLAEGYPCYDTSVGWFDFRDDQIVSNARRAIDQGFTAMKLKAGSRDLDRDIHRTALIREIVGSSVQLMVDANQKLFLETIPHLDSHFAHPAMVRDGVYKTPQAPGIGTDLKVDVATSDAKRRHRSKSA